MMNAKSIVEKSLQEINAALLDTKPTGEGTGLGLS